MLCCYNVFVDLVVLTPLLNVAERGNRLKNRVSEVNIEEHCPMFQACDFRLLTLACTVEGRRKVWGNLKRAFEPQEFVPNRTLKNPNFSHSEPEISFSLTEIASTSSALPDG